MIRYSSNIKHWVGERIGFTPDTPYGLEILHKGETVGGILYWRLQYEKGSLCDVEVTFALDRTHSFTRDVLDILTRYPFQGLESERLTARITVSNERSARIARKMGMTEDGLIRRGRFEDMRLFGMLRSEWYERSS